VRVEKRPLSEGWFSITGGKKEKLNAGKGKAEEGESPLKEKTLALIRRRRTLLH